MVDTDTNDLLARLQTLSKRERQVLELRCKGMKYVDIGKELHIAESTVKTDIARIYMKLGLDVLDPSVRLKALYDTVCPLLKLTNSQPGATKSLPPNVVDGEVMPDEEEKTIPPAIKDMVEKDGNAVVPWTAAPLVGPPPPPIRPPIWFLVLVVGVAFGICLGAGGVYLFLRPGKGLYPSIPQPSPTNPSQAPAYTATALVAPPKAAIDTTTVIVMPTNTLVSTLNVVPTAIVPSLTNTPFVPPADGILFQDNFDNGISSDWEIIGKDWLVANGSLTLPTSASFHNVYEWIGLNHPEWKNYTVSLDIKNRYGQSSELGNIAIAVRTGSQSNYIGVQLDTLSNIYWASIGSSYFDTTSISGVNRDFHFPSGSNVEITVQNNNYTLQVDGRNIQTISLTGYDSGGIKLGIDCESSNECPSIDNVKVMYLP